MVEQPNWWLIPVVAVIPMIIGYIWYNQKLFGNAWMRAAEISEERAQSGNMIKIIGLSYLFCIFGTYILSLVCVHQAGIVQLFLGEAALKDPTSEMSVFINDFMSTYGDRHRTFGHGVIHGIEFALFIGLPFIGVHSLFERRPFKYVWIHLGYWIVSFAIMGGLLCAYF